MGQGWRTPGGKRVCRPRARAGRMALVGGSDGDGVASMGRTLPRQLLVGVGILGCRGNRISGGPHRGRDIVGSFISAELHL